MERDSRENREKSGDYGEMCECMALLMKDFLEQHSLHIPDAFYKALLQTDACDHTDCILRLNLLEEAETIHSCCQGDPLRACVEGVPTYPLYKQLAVNLCHMINGYVGRTPPFVSEFSEDETHKERIYDWIHKAEQYGSTLVKDLACVHYRLHVQDRFLSQLRDGSKTVEGRCATGFYDRIQPGNCFLFNKSLFLRVKEVQRYKSFKEMLETEGLTNVLPGIEGISEGVEVYRKFYSKETESKGVLAIHVAQDPQIQPHKCLSKLMHALQVDGITWLLGLNFTKGTVTGVLPPPRFCLLSSFLSCHSERESSASKLTVGARALAKHAHRSSCGWWGEFTGTEMAKNKLALKVICGIINGACWMNIHRLPHSLYVFEVRVKDGYGARWSSDGSEFRGFLEPQMKDGHALKWRH